MTISIPFIKEKIAYFNDLCFDVALPKRQVKLFKNRKSKKLGYFSHPFLKPDNVSTGLRESFGFNQAYDGLTEQDWEDVIIHEMIHQYLYEKRILELDPHGDAFMRTATEINQEFGRDITAKYGKPNCFVDNRTMCLCRAHDHWCFLACKEDEMDKARKMIDAKHDVVHVYWRTDSHFFLSHANIASRIQWYTITEKQVEYCSPKTYALYLEQFKKEKWKIRPEKAV